MDFSLRVNRKAIATDSSPDRDQQFRYISSLRTRFERQRLPIISVDTKKRELVGNFKNNGVKWDRTPVRVNDHDFRSDAIGVAIPYGIYDLLANRGSVFVGVSHDTAAFAAHFLMKLYEEAGLPPGVINLVYGSGSEVGDPVLASPDLAESISRARLLSSTACGEASPRTSRSTATIPPS
jgi:hypothetical protein